MAKEMGANLPMTKLVALLSNEIWSLERYDAHATSFFYDLKKQNDVKKVGTFA